MSMVSHRLDIAFSHLHSIWKQILKCATVKTLFERVQSCSSVNILTVKTLFERVRCCSSFNILWGFEVWSHHPFQWTSKTAGISNVWEESWTSLDTSLSCWGTPYKSQCLTLFGSMNIIIIIIIIILLIHPSYLADFPVRCSELCQLRPALDWPYWPDLGLDFELGDGPCHALAMHAKGTGYRNGEGKNH